MKKITKKAFKPIDQEEKDLMESIERDEWQPVKNIDQEKEKAIAAARNTLKKEKRINLRLTQKDYYQIQIKASMWAFLVKHFFLGCNRFICIGHFTHLEDRATLGSNPSAGMGGHTDGAGHFVLPFFMLIWSPPKR